MVVKWGPKTVWIQAFFQVTFYVVLNETIQWWSRLLFKNPLKGVHRLFVTKSSHKQRCSVARSLWHKFQIYLCFCAHFYLGPMGVLSHFCNSTSASELFDACCSLFIFKLHAPCRDFLNVRNKVWDESAVKQIYISQTWWYVLIF